ncbi:hypothetical protein SLA2020_368820 [Shorea laevis]
MAIPVFIAGIIKYGERVWILRAIISKQFSNSIFLTRHFFLSHLLRTDQPSQNDQMRDALTIDHEGETFVVAQTLDEYLKCKEVTQEGKNIHTAFCIYGMFIPLFSDLKLRIHKDLTEIIIAMSALVKLENAFKQIQMKLGFLYDVLYTKTTILQSEAGVIFCRICLLSTLLTLIAFSIIVDKRHYPKPDIAMTDMLLTGAFFFDVFAAILHVLSNWTLLHLTIQDNKVHKFIGSPRVSWLINCYGGDKEGNDVHGTVLPHRLLPKG